MHIETLSAKHMNMGFLDVLEELTEVNLTPTEAISAFWNIMVRMNGTIFVAINENKVVGTAAVHILPKFVHRLGSVALIEDVVVNNSFRNKGVGQDLMTEVVNFAKQRDVYKIILNCNLNNIPFYEKCGFSTSEYQMRLDIK